jgi:hypothetical protein
VGGSGVDEILWIPTAECMELELPGLVKCYRRQSPTFIKILQRRSAAANKWLEVLRRTFTYEDIRGLSPIVSYLLIQTSLTQSHEIKSAFLVSYWSVQIFLIRSNVRKAYLSPIGQYSFFFLSGSSGLENIKLTYDLLYCISLNFTEHKGEVSLCNKSVIKVGLKDIGVREGEYLKVCQYLLYSICHRPFELSNSVNKSFQKYNFCVLFTSQMFRKCIICSSIKIVVVTRSIADPDPVGSGIFSGAGPDPRLHN